jgi:hypothetical protein
VAQLALVAAASQIPASYGILATLAPYAGATIGAYIDRKYLFASKERPQWPTIDEVRIQTSRAGIGIPINYGTYRYAGNIIWATKPVKRVFNGIPNVVISLAIGICEGPVDALLRIWADDELFLDLREGHEDVPDGLNSYVTSWTWYPGNETQLEDPVIKAGLRTDDPIIVPAHRGMSYIVLEELRIFVADPDRDKWGGTIPNLTFEVSKAALATPFDPMFLVSTPPSGTVRQFVGFEDGASEVVAWVRAPTAGSAVVGRVAAPVHSGLYAMAIVTQVGASAAQFWISVIRNDSSSGGSGYYSNSPVNPFYLSFCWLHVGGAPGSLTLLCTLQGWGSSGPIGYVGVMRLYHNSDGRIYVSGQTSIGEEFFVGSTVVTPDIFNLIQIEFHHYGAFVQDSTFKLYLNGSLEIEGQFRTNASNPLGVRVMSFGPEQSRGMSPVEWVFDDIVICGPDWSPGGGPSEPGDGEDGFGISNEIHYGIHRIPLVAEGTHQDWNGDVADAEDAEDADSLTANGDGDKQTFTLLDDADTFQDVIALRVQATSKIEEFSGSLHLVTISNGIEDVTDAQIVRGLEGDPDEGLFFHYDELTKVFRRDFGRGDQYWEKADVLSTEVGMGLDGAVPNEVGQVTANVLHQIGYPGSAAPDDWLVFHPDLTRCYIQQYGIWVVWNCATNSQELRRTHRVGFQQRIPIEGSGFDIDENGDVYSTVWYQDPDAPFSGGIGRLDPETLQLVQVTSNLTINLPTVVRVSEQPDLPFLYILASEGGVIHVVNRSDFLWGADLSLDLSPPTDYVFAAIDVGHTVYANTQPEFNRAVLVAVLNGEGAESGNCQIMWTEPVDGEVPEQFYLDISSEFSNASVVLYDVFRDLIMVGQKTPVEKVAFYDVETVPFSSPILTLLGELTGEVVPEHAWSAWRNGIKNGGLIYAWEASTLHRIDIANRVVSDTWVCDASDDTVPVTPNWLGGNIYDVNGHSVISGCDLETTSYVRVYLDRATAGTITLADIVEDICTRVDLTAGEQDTTALTDNVYGYSITNRTSARSAIEPLEEVYFFDGVESDGKLKFPKRGGASVVTIPADDLGAHEAGSERPQSLVTTRQQELELPNRVEVRFIDYENDYEQGLRHDIRQVTESDESLPIDAPICLTGAEAVEIATKRLVYAWIQRVQHQAVLPRAYWWLDPADVVTIEEASVTHLIRLDETVYGRGTLEIQATDELPAAYSAEQLVDPEPAERPTVSAPGPTNVAVIDVGILFGLEDRPGIYMAGIGYLDSWRGATGSVSRDTRASWSGSLGLTDSALVGKAGSVLADVEDPFIWDDLNTLTVYPTTSAFAPSTLTEAQILKGQNLAVVGSEVIGFQTAVSNADGTWTLSRLLRGRRGTDWATGSHAVGERVVLLSPATVRFFSLELADLGSTLYFRANSSGGQGFSASTAKLIAMNHLMPLSPVHVAGERDGSGNLTIGWFRRSRKPGPGTSGTDVPLAEESESYEIDIYDGSTVVRTLTSTTTSVAYTAAQQTTDFGATEAAIDIEIVQMSAAVGRGHGRSATV